MKFQVEIEINLPRKKVLEHYTNLDNLQHWVDGFISVEHVTGEVCKPGARYEVKFRVGNLNILATETITRNDLPEELWLEEECDGLTNLAKNFFIDLGNGKTKWVIISDHSGEFLPKIGASAFKKKTVKFMESFKKFMEAL